ncbi:MAG: hypothetical protein A2268_16160 [Candidatus Raymondbacteria bacterium RifOxyA12_full_50_37]|uniref:Glycosyltransferase subfamily 4-like N-terminal domain-containing protein n=1 Tax=Candidatus Raymondbacteria bacterium RIFOXYD12_FULL_49_13 TaxID=1817890 RepID=A0A1F7FC77_UNCRA|nr:MAG: hypothetical protein A2268_16160 [Candidatus Raymondbacteria bacterium RifOxyA12_full_50_37]OGJ94331.1 MAG: hypothetical protein A2248_14355 [Candidatus Raymondbacteria bacterium RIFOXYA2_FULL_49_16]OGJ95273.1 MAG: hypothetical protein A2453_05780 [Candidatus Raymondbacteria bacterium RIFOXYC2_FULL_50_21]OGK04112.1 MAG: hypothetical protein A2519_19625 [Candidatus Raymondbacteria bacterium RIFOXYD12_FULL_49_13]OGK04931.1 MAG: hypothetical protein A2487_19340 [Candidatus Raymondbacteria 
MKTTVFAACISDLTTEYRLYRQARSLVRQGCDVRVVSYADPEKVPALGHWAGLSISLIRLSRSRLPGVLFFALYMIRLFFMALHARPAFYLACDLPALFPCVCASLLRGGSVVYDSRELYTELPDVHRSPFKKAVWRLLEGFSVRHVVRSITVCESDRSDLARKYNCLAPVVVRNLPLYKPYAPNNALREQCGVSGDMPIIVFQGSLLRSGGVHELVCAMDAVSRAHLVIIGDGPEAPRVRKALRDNNRAQRVSWLPPVPFTELHGLLCSADVGVFTGAADGASFANALPNKIFDYAMAGLPMAVSRLPEIEKVNGRYRFGVYIEAPHPDAIARALNDLLVSSAHLAEYRTHALAMARDMRWENEEERFLELFL